MDGVFVHTAIPAFDDALKEGLAPIAGNLTCIYLENNPVVSVVCLYVCMCCVCCECGAWGMCCNAQ